MREVEKYSSLFCSCWWILGCFVTPSQQSLCHHSSCYCCLLNSGAQQGLFATWEQAEPSLRAHWGFGLTGEGLGAAAINKCCSEGSKGTLVRRLMESLQKIGKRTLKLCLFILASQSRKACRGRSRRGPSVAAEHSPRGVTVLRHCFTEHLSCPPPSRVAFSHALPEHAITFISMTASLFPSVYWWIIILNSF